MHAERRDDLAAYALGALDQPTAADLETHLAGCEACSEYLRWLEPAVDLLPASVEQVEPPASLKRNLMEAVRADAATAPRPPRSPAGVGAGAASPCGRPPSWRPSRS